MKNIIRFILSVNLILFGLCVSASTVTISTSAVGGGSSLPDQTGNSGKYLTTNGSTASWGTVSAGASTALDNLDAGNVRLNTDLECATDGSCDLGSDARPIGVVTTYSIQAAPSEPILIDPGTFDYIAVTSRINGVLTPTQSDDAATKGYVDGLLPSVVNIGLSETSHSATCDGNLQQLTFQAADALTGFTATGIGTNDITVPNTKGYNVIVKVAVDALTDATDYLSGYYKVNGAGTTHLGNQLGGVSGTIFAAFIHPTQATANDVFTFFYACEVGGTDVTVTKIYMQEVH